MYKNWSDEFKSLAHDFGVSIPITEKIIAKCCSYEAARNEMLQIVFPQPSKGKKVYRCPGGVRFSPL